MTRWIFLRHGQSIANAQGWLSGWKDVALTEQGWAEARKAGAQLQASPIDRCLVSDLLRARQTLAAALGERVLPTHVLGDLRERRMGVLTGASTTDLKQDGRFAQYLAPWQAHPEGGESHQECTRRVIACLKHWDIGGTTLVVGHGGWMRDLLALMEGARPDEIGLRPPAPNATPIFTNSRLPCC